MFVKRKSALYTLLKYYKAVNMYKITVPVLAKAKTSTAILLFYCDTKDD